MPATILYLTDSVEAALRNKAAELGVPHSALADVCLARALKIAPDGTLKAWVMERAANRAHARGPTKTETKVLETMRAQLAMEGGGWKWSHTTVAREAGLRLMIAYRALKALEQRGLVKGDELPELDRWGTPKTSFWTLTGPDGQPVKG